MADQDPTATPGSSSSAPRLAHDLRAIREARSVSLDAVQRETKMPADILRRFEAGDLVGDPHYNEVYLRNLLKAYAQAVAISPAEVMSAYDRAKSGGYQGELRKRYLAAEGARPAEEGARPKPEPEAPVETPKRAAPKPATGGTAPAVAALSKPPAKPVEKAEREPQTDASPKRRVVSESAAGKPIEKSWGLIIGGTVAALVVIGGILWFLFRDDSPQPEPVAAPPPAADTASVAEAEVDEPEPVASTAPRFQTPIRVTVIASGGPLQGFRVTEGSDARRPYWLEQGSEQTFESPERVIIWGEESGSGYAISPNMRLRLQGIEWDPQDGRVLRITPANGQALLDSLARTGAAAGANVGAGG